MSTLTGGEGMQSYLECIAKRINDAGLLRVGFLENATYSDGTHVAEIAAKNEYGAKGVPMRPYFRTMIKEKKKGWAVNIGNVLAVNNYDIDKTWNIVGNKIVSQLQESIQGWTSPPNSPVTNLLKQRFPRGDFNANDKAQAEHDVANGANAPAGKPLIWSGHMLNSAAYDYGAKS